MRFWEPAAIKLAASLNPTAKTAAPSPAPPARLTATVVPGPDTPKTTFSMAAAAHLYEAATPIAANPQPPLRPRTRAATVVFWPVAVTVTFVIEAVAPL